MDPKVIRENAIRDAKTNLILDAARKVFSEMGFYDARLEDIAAAAGFSKAALYTYYEDKEEIFMSLAIRELEQLLDGLSGKIDPDAPVLSNLGRLLQTGFTFFGEHFALLLAVANFQGVCKYHFSKMTKTHEELSRQLAERFRALVAINIRVFQIGRKKGEIRSELDDARLASYLGALIRGVIFDWQINGRMGDVETEVKQIVSFVENGVCCSERK